MLARTLQALEFDRIVEVVQGLALTPLGANELRQLRPLTDPTRVSTALSTTTECVRYLDTNPPLDLQATEDLEPALAALAVERVEQGRPGARQLGRLVQVVTPSLEGLLAEHGATVAFHRRVVCGE